MPYSDPEKQRKAEAESKRRRREARRQAADAEHVAEGGNPLALPPARPGPKPKAERQARRSDKGGADTPALSEYALFWDGFAAGYAWRCWEEVRSGRQGIAALDPAAAEESLFSWLNSETRGLFGFYARLGGTADTRTFSQWLVEMERRADGNARRSVAPA